MSVFASNLRRLREARGLTLTNMAKALEISLSTCSHYEKGDREPSILNIKRIADYLGVTTDELFRGVSEENKVQRVTARLQWCFAGFDVSEVEDGYVRIEPPAEATDCFPLEINKVQFGRLTRLLIDECQQLYPHSRELADRQFEIWAKLITNRLAAVRRLSPLRVLDLMGERVEGRFYLPDLPAPATEKKASE